MRPHYLDIHRPPGRCWIGTHTRSRRQAPRRPYSAPLGTGPGSVNTPKCLIKEKITEDEEIKYSVPLRNIFWPFWAKYYLHCKHIKH